MPMPTIEEMRSRLDEIQQLMEAINEEAGDQDLDDEQRATWGELDTEHNTLTASLKRAERLQKVQESRANWGSMQVMPGKDDPFAEDVRTMEERKVLSRSMQVVEDKVGGSHLRDDQKTHITKLLRTRNGDTDGDLIGRLLLATENPHYRSAFQKVAASATPAFTADEGRAIDQVKLIKRAMSIGVDASGGFAVPVLIDPTIILTAQGSPNDILRLARVETITNDEWKGITSAGVSWQFSAEGAATTDNSPAIGQPVVTTKRADGFIPFSIEVGMDWPGFAEQMSGLLAEGYDELLAQKLTTSTANNNEPWGLIGRLDSVTTWKVELATASVVAGADIYKLWAALPVKWRRKAACAWMSSTGLQNAIRQLGTVDPNFTVNITEEAIPRLFGREYPMNDFMSGVTAGTGVQPLLVVGDFKQYLVAQRAGMTVEFLPMLFDVTNNRPTGQRGWFAWARVGADAIVPGAFRMLVNRSA
jgi:HK97 family phage major capsid protein